MKTINVEFKVRRPPSEVFGFLTDFGQLRRWRTVESLRVEPDGALKVGTRIYTAVRSPMGRMCFANEVTALDLEKRSYADKWLNGTFLIQSSWSVVPDGDGSRVLWGTQHEERGLLRLATPFLGKAIRQGQMTDLEKLRRLLETPA